MKTLLLTFAGWFLALPVFAQLAVTPGLTPTQLASMLAGQGVQVFNVTYTGSAQAEGSFTATGTNLGLDSGIVLSTGNAIDAIGPNTVDNSGVDLLQPGDPDLDTLLTSTGTLTQDAAILEFDFIPQNDTVDFRYVFASEEYPEYVCSQFNDVFAFYISGPGITGTANAAIIPGTTQAVTINSVNSGVIGANGAAGPACILGYSNFYVDNTLGTTIQFDGFTTVLTAEAIVTKCQVYHLKIAIADAGDGVYDSGVFLEKGSLYSPPVMYAGVDRGICPGNTTNLGAAPIAGWTYSWTPSTGLNNAGISNPTSTLQNNGITPVNYTYVETATDGTCVLHDTVVVTVNPIPTTTFSVTTPICAGSPTTVTYTGNVPLTTSTFNWSFPGSTSSTINSNLSYNVVYPASGVYNITLSVLAAGCASPTHTAPVRVFPMPVPNFAIDNSLCAGEITTLTSAGSIAGATASYGWTLGGATVVLGSGSGPYQLMWPNAGTYNVALTIVDSGCVAHATPLPVTVTANPVASVTLPSSLCSGVTDTITLNGTAVPGVNYNWDFGNATIVSGAGAGPYTVHWNVSGTDTVRLVASQNGCADSIAQFVQVYQQPVAVFTSPASACASDSVTVSFTGSAGAGTNYGWTFPGTSIGGTNGTGPFHLAYNTAGTYPITLYLENNGCNDTLSQNILINPIPVASVTAPLSACTGISDTVTISGSAVPGVTYTWNFGGASVVSGSGSGPYLLNWSSAGADTIKLRASQNGCVDSTQELIQVYQQPVAAFTSPASACAGDSITISFTGTASSGTNYGWTFPGTTPAGTNGTGPFHLAYNTSGNYPITLYLENHGCNDTIAQSVQINGVPIAQFISPNQLCSGSIDTVYFNGSAEASAVFTWNFGNASTLSGSGAGPYALLWNTPGNSPVSLTIDQSGCKDSNTANVDVIMQPTAQFVAPLATCAGDSIHISFSGTSDSTTVYHWTFQNGFPATASSSGPIAAVWNSSGSYPITLSTSNQMCKDTIVDTLVVNPAPVAAFQVSPVCDGLPVNVTDQSQMPGSGTGTWHYDFGDSFTSSASSPQHLYAQDSSYVIHLTVTSDKGCIDSTQRTVFVYPVPLVAFTNDSVCEGLPTHFISQSSIHTGTILNSFWDAGDGGTMSGNTAQHAYAQGGVYNAQLVAVSDHGCSDTISNPVRVWMHPVPGFTGDPTSGCAPLEANFTDGSTVGDGTIEQWNWLFGDGFTDSIQGPTHTYTQDGHYSVQLGVVSSHGCIADTTYDNYITVFPKPTAAFTYTPSKPDIILPTVEFFNRTGAVNQWEWSFGDGATDNQPDVQHTYTAMGTYPVELIVTNQYGCKDTANEDIIIAGAYTLWIPNAFSPNGDTKNDQFHVKAIGITEYHIDIFSRWGRKIYSSNEINDGWDGSVDNGTAVEDTYVYLITAKDILNEEHVFSGRVSVIK